MSGVVVPFAWYGGKSRLAGRIVGLLPPHATYVEVCGGSAAVLFAKQRTTLEVYNDVDRGLVTFFRVLRDRPADLARSLRLTPYSRDEFDLGRMTWAETEDELERARRWYVRTRQAFAGTAVTAGWGFETTGDQRGGIRSNAFVSSVDELERFAARFRSVQVDRLDATAALERYDRPGACFYVDPPYHPETRGRLRGCYAHDLDAAGHSALVDALLEVRASVLVSGYDHVSYAALADAGFERFEFEHVATASRLAHGRGRRLEIVWRRLEQGVHERTPALWEQGVGRHP